MCVALSVFSNLRKVKLPLTGTVPALPIPQLIESPLALIPSSQSPRPPSSPTSPEAATAVEGGVENLENQASTTSGTLA